MTSSIRANASTLAWVFAFLAVTVNTAAAFGAEGNTFDVIRFVVAVLFTLLLVIAIVVRMSGVRR